ncbi:hypothetical protein H3Z83_07620 [Tenacibaculum sp. S7007]|uniref:Uncharacterized protein n=1 Tax=Tenacibaculum pelagium TaxID=2759527 RepID=A0A839APS5_9FLAO|nr:hypothetical protein [Tenacibaculum pelagium]MBA6156380.1 hypothetical protein [Tenacibaculum pelagium]
MKKSILNLGNALNKAEQKSINGGMFINPCNGSSIYNDIGGGECTYTPKGMDTRKLCLGQISNGFCAPLI